MEKISKNEAHAEGRAARKGEYRKVSVGGWMGTIVLSAIPILNLILWIIWASAAKRPSRKSYASAMLILTAIFLLLIAVAIMVFGNDMLSWAKSVYPELFAYDTPVGS